jgi:hypothetical protein
MPDYTPVYLPGDTQTALCSAAVKAHDCLEVTGSGTVAKAAAALSLKVIGVAAFDCAINQRVTFYSRGMVHEGFADGAITAGDQVVASSTTGRMVATLPPTAVTEAATYAHADTETNIDNSVNAARAVLGVALTTAADGALVRWMQI